MITKREVTTKYGTAWTLLANDSAVKTKPKHTRRGRIDREAILCYECRADAADALLDVCDYVNTLEALIFKCGACGLFHIRQGAFDPVAAFSTSLLWTDCRPSGNLSFGDTLFFAERQCCAVCFKPQPCFENPA